LNPASPAWTSAPGTNHATPFPGKDAFHRVPDFAQMRFAICHLPFAISHSLLAICYLLSPVGYWLFGHGLSALDPIGSSLRIPTQ